MAIQRKIDPLPPGRYWITIQGQAKQAEFDRWLFSQSGAVKVEVCSLDDGSPSTEFVIFRVPEGQKPFFPPGVFGLPSTAPEGVRTLDDVLHAPAPEPSFELPSAGNLFDGMSLGLLALGAFLLLRK